MKNLILFAALAFPVTALADDTDKAVGAVVGGLVGSTVGHGDGRVLATAAGAVIGYSIADGKFNRNSAKQRCERQVPERYLDNRRARKSWVKGCVQRMEERQERLEERAYRDGYREHR